MTLPIISVILPTYNGRSTLVAAVESVLEQKGVDIELIIIDDNSSGETADICRRLAVDSPCVKLFRNNNTKGAANSRNIGVSFATADVIAFMDDDDYWYPNKLREQWTELDKDERVGLVGCGRYQRYVDDDIGYRSVPAKEEFTFHELLMENWLGGTSSVVVRKAAFEEAGGFRGEYPAREEYDLWLRIASRWKVRVVRKVLMEYRHSLRRERISSNVLRYVRGCELLNELHKESIDALNPLQQRRRLAAQYQFIAAQAIKVNARWLAFIFNLKAFRLLPALRPALGAATALFGYRLAVRARALRGR